MENRNSFLWLVCIGYAVVLGGVGCSSGAETKSETSGFFLSTAKWQTPEVKVCWEQSAGSAGAQRRLVKQAVEREYNGPSPLSFVGWVDCSADPRANIRIRVADVGPHTTGLGRIINQRPNGMVLNFTFENWSQSCQNNPQRCIESIAVHEFGHAAGLAHEQNRGDRPDDCHAEAQGTSGDVAVGVFDRRSAMNYCNPLYNNNGHLSAGDLEALRRAYPNF